jgi:hypothetical protein
MPPRLPVWRTVGACYAIVARNLSQLVRISWLWLLIMLPAYAAVHWLIWSEAGQPESGIIAQALTMLPNVIELPALASIAVAWHRLVLREEGVNDAFYLRLDRAVWWYALVLFVFLALAVGPFVSGAAPVLALPENPDGLWVVLMYVAAGLAIALLVLPRVWLVLPAIALGEPLSLAGAWRATRGNTWRLAWAGLLCSLPPLVPFFPLFLVRRFGRANRVRNHWHRLLAGLCADRHDSSNAAVAGVPLLRAAGASRDSRLIAAREPGILR